MSNRGGMFTIPAAANRLGEHVDLVDHILSNHPPEAAGTLICAGCDG
jgi:hypothetical protein